LIADEFVQEVISALAAIKVGQTDAGQMDAEQEDAKQADAEAAPRKPIRVETLATVLVTLAFSLGGDRRWHCAGKGVGAGWGTDGQPVRLYKPCAVPARIARPYAKK